MKKKTFLFVAVGILLTVLAMVPAANSVTNLDAAKVSEAEPSPDESCRKVGYIGASLSDYNIGSAPLIKKLLTERGYTFIFNASAGRSLTSPGVGSGRAAGPALEVLTSFKGKGVDCFIIAIGTNDSAELRGNYSAARYRIERAMSIVNGSPIQWIAPVTQIKDKSKPYCDQNMAVFRRALHDAAKQHANLTVHYWGKEPKEGKNFWNKDKIHLNAGKEAFAAYAVDTLSGVSP